MCHLSRKLYALSTKTKRINPDPTTHSDQINRKSKSRLIFLNTQSQQKNPQTNCILHHQKMGRKRKSDLENQSSFFIIQAFLFPTLTITMQKQDFFSKQPKKADFSGGVIRNPQQKKSWAWIRIVIILLIWGVGYLMKNKLFNPSLPTPAVENGYTVGNPIEKEGKLTADGDLLTYTHTLTTPDGEKFLLKSSTISLNNYTIMTGDIFKIEGTIEAIYQGQALVEVKTIEKNSSGKSETDSLSENSEETTNPGVYLNQAGIWFLWSICFRRRSGRK